MISRTLYTKITHALFKGKVIILYGARQVGKTTLVKHICQNTPDTLYLNCDEPDIRDSLTHRNSTQLKTMIGSPKILVIDEAQRVPDIGLTLKLLNDTYPEIQIIATGSSSFELANKIVEPLTGRKIEYMLYPIATTELRHHTPAIELYRQTETRLIYGNYPEILNVSQDDAKTAIQAIAKSYLYKDILSFHKIRHPESLEKLLQALALQIGNEVSYTELSQLIGIDKNTVETYIRILEQAFVIFRLKPLHRNLRNEIKQLRKIYFVDTGIRNAIINNFNPLDLRTDKGALWENFLISERRKAQHYAGNTPNTYFWRTHAGQEVDYIEEESGQFNAFEFKWKPQRYTAPKTFVTQYTTPLCIDSTNYLDQFLPNHTSKK